MGVTDIRAEALKERFILRRKADQIEDPVKTSLETVKKIVDKVVSSAQNDKRTVKISIELNLRNGGIGSMFVEQREQAI